MRGHLVRERLSPNVREWQGRSGDGGHWAQIAEVFTTPAYEEKIKKEGAPTYQFLAREGDVLIWHGKLVHGGSTPAFRGIERPAIICHYYPADLKVGRVVRDKDGGYYFRERDY